MLVVTVLSSCSTTISYDNCPVYPVAGVKVGQELANVPYQGYENFWEWIGRIDKLRQELELCR